MQKIHEKVEMRRIRVSGITPRYLQFNTLDIWHLTEMLTEENIQKIRCLHIEQ